MVYKQSDDWYFGDYFGRLPGKQYSLLLNGVIILLFVQIALSTEPALQTKSAEIWLDFSLNIIEIFFVSDYIGKLANSWAHQDYTFVGLCRSCFARLALVDLFIVATLLSHFFPNDGFVVIGVYVAKAITSIYFSSFQRVLRRVNYIVFDSPAYTFFPLILLAIVTYVLALCMYLLEGPYDPEHFGSIVRAFWFSIVTLTTIGYGDVTPFTALGKGLAIAFGIVGIVCVALLTANIVEANAKFNELDANDPS